MQVMIPTQPGEKVTLFDQIYANLQAKFAALFFPDFCCSVFCGGYRQRLYQEYRRAGAGAVSR